MRLLAARGFTAAFTATPAAIARTALAALLALFVAGAFGADGDFVAVPQLRAHVTDLTGTLSDSDKAALERKLADWESKRGAQFAVLMVPTTKPDAIEDYSQRVTDQWQIGRKGVDDGVLLLVAKDDKKLRIQVGKGFEGSLTDVTAKRIVDEVIVPLFRKGDFAGGINAGVDRVIGVVAGEALPPAPAKSASARSHSGGWHIEDWIGFALFAGLGLFWFLASLLNRMFGRVGGSLVGGGIAGVVAWLATSIVVVAVGAGVVAFILLLIALAARGGSGLGHGGFIGFPGGFGGSGSSGGGASWSGGGGDFGGGGASGGWGNS